jgi:hypothetical protein
MKPNADPTGGFGRPHHVFAVRALPRIPHCYGALALSRLGSIS